MSIKNVVGRLRVHTGNQAGEVQFFYPTDAEAFDMPWKTLPGVISANFDLVVEADQVQMLTAEQILEVYKKTE